jgi:hypothetical protein
MNLANASAGGTLPLYDLTARKAHQWAMLVLLAIGFLVGEPASIAFVALAGAIMLLGRLWWPFDVVRQLVWRALEPWGILRRYEAYEDRETRRIARTIGGVVWLVAALLLAAGATTVGWIVVGIIAVMVLLDAAADFCALCFVFSQLERRGLLLSIVSHAPTHTSTAE